jgi:predicted peptidase
MCRRVSGVSGDAYASPCMNTPRLLVALLCLSGLGGSVLAQPSAPSLQREEHFEAQIRVTARFDYLLFLPRDYAKSRKRWPLMLFLHGAGEAGTNVERLKVLGPPMIVESQPDFPFILVSPQSPVRHWDPEKLNAFLDYVIRKYRVDKDRVYLTGASMGGSGTWALAAAQPEKFAAIVPVCGSGNPADAARLARLPIWVFQGAKDPVVHLARAQAMVEAVKAAGGNVKFTVYPDAGHNVWTRAYADPELYRWLLEQKRRRR